ncbi:MAG: O-methyltransferase [Clostridia bacterium]|nr:O-methyltransferase [Clostridia bacterium]
MIYPELNNYLRSQLIPNTGLLKELEEFAKNPYIPIIQPEVAQLLKVFFSYSKPKKLLEVGTAIGYSAIFFAELMGKKGEIVTIERNPDMIKLAKENIQKAGLVDRITILEGDAKEILPALEGEFDTVFLDGAKGQYGKFLPKILQLLPTGGTLITDNILYRGIVASEELAPKKHITIARNLRSYIYDITHNHMLETTVIPIGDGVGISRKIRGEGNEKN